MACRTGVCGMRRFDGHGASSYRPTNPEAAKEQSAALRSLLAERERQDAGLFGSVQKATTLQNQTAAHRQKDGIVAVLTASTYSQKASEETAPTYSLSDAGSKTAGASWDSSEQETPSQDE